MPDELYRSSGGDDAHITPAQLAAFVDGTIGSDARLDVVRHLATCPPCRDEAAEVHAMLAVAPAWRARRLRMLAPLAGVAATLVVMVLARTNSIPNTDESAVRRAPPQVSTEEAPAVPLATPGDDAVVATGEVRFAWRQVAGEATYLAVVQDSTGTLVWSAVTRDTTAVVPRSAALSPGAAYFWSVDAQWGDGRSSRSAARRFTVR